MVLIRRIYIVFICLIFSISGYSQLVMNEMMSDNETTLMDEEGDYPDWIEIFNTGGIPLNLEGFFLTDDSLDIQKWAFPSIELKPDSFLIVFASGKDTLIGDFLHANFKISSDGEWLGLANSDQQILDQLPPIELDDDISYGRRPDGSDQFFYFDFPTPGSSNLQSNSLTFSHERGYYTDPFNLTISSNDAQAEVYYTTDGSEPTTNSNLYQQSISVDYRDNDPNTISMIPTTPDSLHTDRYHWKPPVGKVDKVNVIRVRSFVNNSPSSKVYSMTYVVDSLGTERYSFPMLSIITDQENFFNHDTGIYVPGVHWDENDPWWTGNYFMKFSSWTRNVHVEYFENSGELGFSQDAGVKIHGKSTRRTPQKSLKFFADEKYGKKEFDYPLFPGRDKDEYKIFILKNTFGCQHGTIIKDDVAHQLVMPLGMDVMDYQPVIVFLNGEYWGFQTIRENQNEDYIAYLYDIETDSMNILENKGSIVRGTNEDYHELLDFIELNDLSIPANYTYVTSQMDVYNYIDLFIAEIYLNNYDWPGSNMEFWQSPKLDDKWRWMFFDLDYAFGNASYNMLEHATLEGGTAWPNPDWSTFLFRNLLKSDEFTAQFIDRFAELLNTRFQDGIVVGEINQLKQQYGPEMGSYIDRYGYPADKNEWFYLVDHFLITFAEDRPCEMEDQIRSFFMLEDFDFDCHSGSGDTLKNPDGNLVFPNPSAGNFYIRLDSPEKAEIYIFDSMGRKVYSFESQPEQINNTINLSIPGMKNGVYFVVTSQPGNTSSYKLTISK